MLPSGRVGMVLLALIALPSCDIFGPDVEPLDGSLAFRVRELHGLTYSEVGEPDVGLLVETEREYSCLLPLEAELSVTSSVVSVAVRGVGRPEMCPGAVGPASYRTLVPIGAGEHALRFGYAGEIDTYTLVISDQAVEIEGANGRFTAPAVRRFWRYPPNSFASVCDAGDGHEAACDEFRATLERDLAIEGFTFPPGGVIPYPTAFAAHGRDWRVGYYRYADESTFRQAGEALRAFMEQHPAVTVYVVNWLNEAYRSWLGGS